MKTRIISGNYRGRNIYFPDGIFFRPSLQRVKKSIFDILKPHVKNSLFLDLFACSGNVGIEALSREAKKVLFVEHSQRAIRMLKKNLSMLNISREDYEIRNRDVYSFISTFTQRPDIIFLDPPYTYKKTGIIIKKSLALNPQILIAEVPFGFDAEDIDGWVKEERRYGQTKIYIFKSKSNISGDI